MNSEIRTAIEAHYDLTLQKCVPAPRQFVAETYILTDTQGRHYFCKCVDKPLFIPDIIKSLPIVEAMFAQGVDWIGYPIRAAGTLHMFLGDTLVVLFNYIPAPQSYEYRSLAVVWVKSIRSRPTLLPISLKRISGLPIVRNLTAGLKVL